jgi:hypothetical protein
MTNGNRDARSTSDRREERRTAGDYKYVFWFLYGFLSLGFLWTALLVEPKHAMVGLLWAMACFVSGGTLGFLFGVPKVLQQGGRVSPGDPKSSTATQDQAPRYRQEVNTNLTEISDWLTKMIVGVGLVNLKEIPQFVRKVAFVLASSMAKSDADRDFVPYAVGVIVFFSVLGFLFGYLSTRLFLAGAFARADVGAIAETRLSLDSAFAEVASIKAEVAVMKDVKLSAQPLDSKEDRTEPVAEGASVGSRSAQEQVVAAAQRALEADSIRDTVRRVAGKDQAATEIARLVLSGAVSKDWVVAEVSRQAVDRRQDGLIAGLALAANISPEPGDFQRLSQAALRADWPNTRHKLCVAIGKLFSIGVATREDVPEAERILASFLRGGADEPLQRTIRETVALITRSTGLNISLPNL